MLSSLRREKWSVNVYSGNERGKHSLGDCHACSLGGKRDCAGCVDGSRVVVKSGDGGSPYIVLQHMTASSYYTAETTKHETSQWLEFLKSRDT